jgi:hypothetical protein
VFALALAFAAALPLNTTRAQIPEEPLISPAAGEAGSRFQVVGQSGWTPGEIVTLSFGFSDEPPGTSFAGPFYHERQATVLRDGTWSFPVVVNDELFPFPLYRPGFIIVKAQSPSKVATNSFVYTVAGQRPLGPPPLASFGFGPAHASHAFVLTAALFAAGIGALITISGAWRRRATATAAGG